MSLQHTVVFRLVHDIDSEASAAFLADAREILTAVPGVQDFTINRQVSPKSDLTLQFSMWFESEAHYAAYDQHPAHVAFVAERWVPEVAEFQEYDFLRL